MPSVDSLEITGQAIAVFGHTADQGFACGQNGPWVNLTKFRVRLEPEFRTLDQVYGFT